MDCAVDVVMTNVSVADGAVLLSTSVAVHPSCKAAWDAFELVGVSDVTFEMHFTMRLVGKVVNAAALTPETVSSLYALLFLTVSFAEGDPTRCTTYTVVIRGAEPEHALPKPMRESTEQVTPRGSIKSPSTMGRAAAALLTPREEPGVQFSNPVLTMVHADSGRKLVRKCELDDNLEFSALVVALIKYPDREDDLAAFVNTVPLWSDAVSVLKFIASSKRAAKLRESTVKFLSFFAATAPWTVQDEDALLAVAAELQLVFDTDAVGARIRNDRSLASQMVKTLFGRVVPGLLAEGSVQVAQEPLRAAIKAHEQCGDERAAELCALFEEQGLLLRVRPTLFCVTRRGLAPFMSCAPSAINPLYVDVCKRMVAGYESIPVVPWSSPEGLPFDRTFERKAAVAYLKTRLHTDKPGARCLLQSLCDQGIVARCDGEHNNIGTPKSRMAVTRFGHLLLRDLLDGASTDDSLKAHHRSADSSRRGTSSAWLAKVVPPPSSVRANLIPFTSPREGSGTLDMNDPLELARQLSLVFQGFYRNIRPHHLLKQNWTKPEAQANGNPVADLFMFVRNLSTWVSLQVLSSPPAEAPALFSKLVTLAAHLRSLHNYSATFAVVLGLSAHAVSRLELKAADDPQVRLVRRCIIIPPSPTLAHVLLEAARAVGFGEWRSQL